MAIGFISTDSPLLVARLAADPASPTNGLIYYNTVSNLFRMYQNGGWTSAATLSDLSAYLKADGSVPLAGDLVPDAPNTRSLGAPSNAFANVIVQTIQDPTGVAAIDVSNHQLTDQTGAVMANFYVPGQFSLASGTSITGMSDPTSPQDAATKNYVDTVAQGLSPKKAVRAGTTVAGTLATDFADSSVIDTVTLATGDRILIKDQSSAAENGIYVVQASGAPVRATDFDSVSPIDEINGAYTFIQEGSQAGQAWVETGTVTTIGTDPIVFVFFNSATGIVGGDMITVVGSTVSVDLATVSGLVSTNPGNNAGQLKVKLEASNPTLQIDGSNQLGSKLDGSRAITTGASGIGVNVDNSTIDISGNALEVKAGGITNTQISGSAAIAYSKLNLSASIVNADINASAAIVYSKLSLSNSIVNSDINTSAAIAYSKLNLSASIVNADIASGAAIALSKLAALATGKALQSNASTGFIEVSSITNTELGYLSGVTSAIQTQLNAKAPLASPTFTGTLALSSGTNVVEEQYSSGLAISGSQTGTAITGLNIASANYSSRQIYYSFTQTTTNFVRTGTLIAVYDGTNVIISDPQYLETGVTGLSFDTDVSGGNWRILYTSGTNGGTLNCRDTRIHT